MISLPLIIVCNNYKLSVELPEDWTEWGCIAFVVLITFFKLWKVLLPMTADIWYTWMMYNDEMSNIYRATKFTWQPILPKYSKTSKKETSWDTFAACLQCGSCAPVCSYLTTPQIISMTYPHHISIIPQFNTTDRNLRAKRHFHLPPRGGDERNENGSLLAFQTYRFHVNGHWNAKILVCPFPTRFLPFSPLFLNFFFIPSSVSGSWT